MDSPGVIGFILILTIFLTSFYAFRNRSFFEQWAFVIDKVLVEKEYKRLLTSGFVHGGWIHLILNTMTLYAFSDSVEHEMGYLNYALIYFGSLIGGNLFSLYIHRNHGDYSAVGASGAVSGVIFSYIVLFPYSKIGIFEIYMPGWIYGVLFMFISIYGIKTGFGNIGHDAHFGGALVGMVWTVILFPAVAWDHFEILASIAVPCVVFLFIILKYPSWLFLPSFSLRPKKVNLTFEDKYNEKRIEKQKEIDRILDKISKKGIGSLSQKEKDILDRYSS